MNKRQGKERLKKKLFLLSLIITLLVLSVGSVAMGAVQIGWREVVTIIWQEIVTIVFVPLINISSAEDVSAVNRWQEVATIIFEFLMDISLADDVSVVNRSILLQIRLPRIFLAAVVGASLAVAGVIFQGLFRNPMADPYVIGVSSGAALGAVIAMLTGAGLSFLGFGAVPLFAFTGGLVTILLVYSMARVGGSIPVMNLLLAGIVIGAFLSALVSLLTYFAGEQLHRIIFWLMGGFSGASWLRVKAMIPYVFIGYGSVYLFSKELNVLLLGEETAQHLGVEVEKVKKILLAGASLLVAAAVSTGGIIGFIGLMVPHFVRLVAGPDHRFLLPASALLGAVALVAADTLARTVIAPSELPVGIITALIGAPMFIYLLKKRKKLRYFNSSE